MPTRKTRRTRTGVKKATRTKTPSRGTTARKTVAARKAAGAPRKKTAASKTAHGKASGPTHVAMKLKALGIPAIETAATFRAVCTRCDFVGKPRADMNAAASDGLLHQREPGNWDHIVHIEAEQSG